MAHTHIPAHPNPRDPATVPSLVRRSISSFNGRNGSHQFPRFLCRLSTDPHPPPPLLAFFAFKFAHLFKLFICQFSIYANFQVPAINSSGLFNPFKGERDRKRERGKGRVRVQAVQKKCELIFLKAFLGGADYLTISFTSLFLLRLQTSHVPFGFTFLFFLFFFLFFFLLLVEILLTKLGTLLKKLYTNVSVCLNLFLINFKIIFRFFLCSFPVFSSISDFIYIYIIYFQFV